MIFPNKVFSFSETMVYKMHFILERLENNKALSIHELYLDVENCFDNIDEFMFSLDLLYILEKINVDFKNEEIHYVKTN